MVKIDVLVLQLETRIVESTISIKNSLQIRAKLVALPFRFVFYVNERVSNARLIDFFPPDYPSE